MGFCREGVEGVALIHQFSLGFSVGFSLGFSLGGGGCTSFCLEGLALIHQFSCKHVACAWNSIGFSVGFSLACSMYVE